MARKLSTISPFRSPEGEVFSHAVGMTQNHEQHEPSTRTSTTHHIDPFAFYAVPIRPEISSQLDGPDENISQRVQVREPEELLAYVQSTLGFRPKDSLVVVAFANDQLSTVVRCDLPVAVQDMLRADTPECVTFLDFGLTETQELQLIDIGCHLGRLLAKEPSTTSCLVMFVTDDVTVSDQHVLAVSGAANALIAAQFGLQRVPVEESWIVHESMLWHLKCPATTECDVQGKTLSDPERTEVFAALDPQAKTSQLTSNDARNLIFPPFSATKPRDKPDTKTLLENRPQTVVDWLRLWDEHLSDGPKMMHSDQVATLLEAIEHPRVREAVMALACFDFTTAIQGMVTLGQFPRDVAALADVQLSLADGITVQDCIPGRSERAPNWQRVSALERLCRQLLPLSDALSGGVVAGLLIWVEWARGRGSIALRYATQARKRFPAEQFLVTLEGFLRQGLVAHWATRAHSAWNPQHAA